ncbi:anti-sigma factor [Aestuariimicrobium soli]|uniref:anti-sigma factor n=1 Tax=Aestuariimicrobium soli TaxID=2035834 RepID=UPI003EB912EB
MNDPHANAGAYAVNALDADERAAFELHLRGCEPCTREVAEFGETLALLAADGATAAPSTLRASVLAGIADEPILPAAEPRAITDRPSPVGRLTRLGWWVAAAALVAAIALGTGVVSLRHQEHQQQIRAQQAERQRAELLAAPDLRVHRAALTDGSQLTYLVSQQRAAGMLVASDLADPRQGRVWQLWTMHDGTPRPAGLVSSGGRVEVWITGLAGAQAIAITDEPAGGSDQPTTTPQAVAEF